MSSYYARELAEARRRIAQLETANLDLRVCINRMANLVMIRGNRILEASAASHEENVANAERLGEQIRALATTLKDTYPDLNVAEK